MRRSRARGRSIIGPDEIVAAVVAIAGAVKLIKSIDVKSTSKNYTAEDAKKAWGIS